MSCDGEESVSVINTTSKRLKDGHLRRFKDKMFGSKWPECYAVLYQDSTFVWYDKQGDSSAKGCVQLKNLAPFITVGAFTDKLSNRPSLPDDGRVQDIIAVGTGRSSKIYWFLCKSDESLNEWMSHIISTLPPPPQPPQQYAGPPPMPSVPAVPYTTGNGPPPYTVQPQRLGPPPTYNQQQQPVVYAYQPRPQPSNTTVIIDRGYNSYNNHSGVGLGTGLLVGGVAGYALGSMSHHSYGYGYGGGYGFNGGGYGYGGGYGGGYSDNDTTIVNNYNVTNVNDNDTVNNTYDTTNNDYGGDNDDYGNNYGNGGDDYGGGNDYGGDDYGGDDYGDY